MNAKIIVFVIYVEAVIYFFIIYLLVYNLHGIQVSLVSLVLLTQNSLVLNRQSSSSFRSAYLIKIMHNPSIKKIIYSTQNIPRLRQR